MILVNVSGIKSEEEYFELLRNRVMWCICNKLLGGTRTFHQVEMIKECAGGFADKTGLDEYEFSGDHPYYRHVLERIYTPLRDRGMIEEMENNYYRIPEGSALENICRRELSGGRAYIDYDQINWD